MFANPPVDVLKLQPPTERGRWSSRTRGTPEFMGELPSATLAEEIETPGEDQVRALVTLAGNPVLSSPAGHRLSDALARLGFMVSIDFYLNETTRHADVILPPVGPLERDHFDLAFQLLSVRNTTRWSPAVFEPPADGKNEADILLTLASRLSRGRGASGLAMSLGLGALEAVGGARASRIVLGLALRTGPHGSGLRPWSFSAAIPRTAGSSVRIAMVRSQRAATLSRVSMKRPGDPLVKATLMRSARSSSPTRSRLYAATSRTRPSIWALW